MAMPNLKNVFGNDVEYIADRLKQYATEQLPKLLEIAASKNESGKTKLDLVNAFNNRQFGVKPAAVVAVAQSNDNAAPAQPNDAAASSSFHK